MDGIDKAIPQGADGNLDKAQIDWLRMMPDGWNGDEWESYQHRIPATEENMAKFGWVRERTCRNLDKRYNIMFKCSECGHWECQDFDGEKILPQTWNYCPNCGAKVIGG